MVSKGASDFSNLSVADAMVSAPKMILRSATVLQASQKMLDDDVGSLVVVEGGKVAGMLTKTDVLKKVVVKGKNAKDVKVEEIMSKIIISTTPETSLADAAKKMVSNRVRRLPVIKNGNFVGLLTQTDILKVQPAAIELLVEKFIESANIDVRQVKNVEGVCDACGSVDSLTLHEGSMLCGNCLNAI